MAARRVLILGGTGEARQLAEALLAAGLDPLTSLAGVTRAPRALPGSVRRGGFGGIEGLHAFIVGEDIAAVADVSHPFAARIAAHAYAAAGLAGVPYLRLERAPWVPQTGDRWTAVRSIAEAVAALPLQARALVTIGRKEIAAFLARSDISGVMRMIEAPAVELPRDWSLILARPPFTVEGEKAILQANAISHLVSKNAGGEDTMAKLVAARETKIPVIMIERPAKPPAPVFSSVNEMVPALCRLLSA